MAAVLLLTAGGCGGDKTTRDHRTRSAGRVPRAMPALQVIAAGAAVPPAG
ncbi:MAG: hypothetical protein ACRDRX_25585 [Pseudonocardiaceae bacterium]